IRANTSLMPQPHVPEVSLYLESEAHELCLKTEDELEAIGLPPRFFAFAWSGGQGLARYVLVHADTVRGIRVLVLARGSGL
ncbi:methyltransferase, partial [Rhizobium brockwellii]